MIVDQLTIIVKSGNGGEGNTSFSKFSPRREVGSGGDGGKGGDVIVKISSHLYDLSKFGGAKVFTAEDGEPGQRSNKKGCDGSNLIVFVPEGTLIKDFEGECIIDLIGTNQEWLACRGGMGGKGNNRRYYSIAAQPGEEKELILDYRIPNDVALIGFPNSGKTSLLNKLTGKAYKVADYPFTTTSCVWAQAEYQSCKFTVLDTPPLKKSENTFFEEPFLKQIYRSKIVLLLSDNALEFRQEIALLKKNILHFDPGLLENKKIFYLLTKVDTINAQVHAIGRNVISIAAEKDIGIMELQKKIVKALSSDREANDFNN